MFSLAEVEVEDAMEMVLETFGKNKHANRHQTNRIKNNKIERIKSSKER
jgi:hypothetical protein